MCPRPPWAPMGLFLGLFSEGCLPGVGPGPALGAWVPLWVRAGAGGLPVGDWLDGHSSPRPLASLSPASRACLRCHET